MKYELEVITRTYREEFTTIVVEVPDDTPPEALHRVRSSAFDNLWECNEDESVEFDRVCEVTTLSHDEDVEEEADLRLMLGEDGRLVRDRDAHAVIGSH